MDKARKYAPITDNLNRLLQKYLSQFSNNTEWTDINIWVEKVQKAIEQNPSPYISQKIVLSKRLQQGLNPILPAKTHQSIIRIHQLIFNNMRNSVEGNVNQYIRLFAEDLGVYSVALFPYFAKTQTMAHRYYCLSLFNDYYMDLKKQLIPLIPGLLISLLTVFGITNDEDLKARIFDTFENLKRSTGRKYFIGAVWMTILKHPQCRTPGIHLLKNFIPPMKLMADEDSMESSHGFSDIEGELLAEGQAGGYQRKRTMSMEKSKTRIARESNSLPPIRIEKPKLSVTLDDKSPQKSPLLPPSNTIGQMLNAHKPSTPRNQPSTLPVTNEINKPSNFTPVKVEQNNDSPVKNLGSIDSNVTPVHPKPMVNLMPTFTPPPAFNPPSGFKPPSDFKIPPNFTLPSNFTPPPKLPKTPPRTPPGGSKIPSTNLEKELLEEMEREERENEKEKQKKEQNSSNLAVPVPKTQQISSTSIEKRIDESSKEIVLSPGPDSLMTPPTKPIEFKPPTGMTPPPAGFKFPPGFVIPPPPSNILGNPMTNNLSLAPSEIPNQIAPNLANNATSHIEQQIASNLLGNSQIGQQNKIDFSKMPPPPPGFKFDPTKPMPPPPAGFKFPPNQTPPPTLLQQSSFNTKPPVPPPNLQSAIPKLIIPPPAQQQSFPKPPSVLAPQPPQIKPPTNPPASIQMNKLPSNQQKGGGDPSLEQSRKQHASIVKQRKTVPPLDKFPYVPTPQLQQLNRINDEDIDINNYPNRNSLVLNSIVSCLTDESSLVKRHMLDFMCSHLRVKNKVFENEDKKVIVEAALLLFVKKELTITKRVNNWLFGKPDEEQNKYFITQKNEVIIPFIIEGFQNMLSKQPKSSLLATQPLKVLQNFYMQHQHFVSKTLSPIVLPTIRYIFNFGYGKEYSVDIMKAGQRFFQNIPSFYNVILISLGDELLKAIQAKDDLRCFEVVKYLDFCYIKLMKHEGGPEELEYISNVLYNLARTLDHLSIKEPDLSQYTFIRHLMLLIVNLVDRKDKIDFEAGAKKAKENLHMLDESHIIELPKERVEYERELKQQEEDRQILFKSISESIEKFYVKVGQTIRMCENLLPYEETYKLGSLAITKVQRSLPREEVKILPSWFDAIEVGIKLTNPVISLAAIEAMIFCLTSEAIHPAYNSFKRLIIAEKNKRVGSDYQKQALEKLWSLLDFPHMHKKIIDLIVNFSKYFPYEFTEVVSKSFQTYNVPDKQASIQRFSHFWRLTGKKYKDLLENNHELTELNKVGLFVMLDFLEDDNPLVRHAAKNWLLESMGLFSRVLQPLFSELMQIKDNVFITPQGQNIISKKYDTKKVFGIFRRIKSILTNGASSFLSYIYQTQLTDHLQQLRATFTDISFPIITKQKVDKVDTSATNQIREPVLPKAIREEQEKNLEEKNNINADKLTYMDLLIIISVKYIKGQAIESMGIDFHVGNSSVNAASIEFLETFLGYIDDSKLCERFINFILNDLFHVLQQGVGNQEYIIQVQLLNLFKTIFFNSSFRLKGSVESIRKMFSNIYTNTVFSNSLLKGLNTPFSYVRTQFISFISISIPLIADFLEPEQCTTVIKSILYTYYQIIKGVNMRLVKDLQKQEQRLEEPPANLKRIIEIRERNMKEDKVIKLTDNLSQVAKTNEILAILHGVSVILNYFFELDKLDFKKIQFQFTDPYTVFDTLKTIISLGFASSEKEEKLISKPVFLHNLETCESILRDMGPVFETILRAWPLSEEYVKIATNEFSEIGMKTFGFQRFSKYNSVLKSLIEYVSTEKQSIWGKIISIMKPMFFKFPKQIVSIYIELWIRQCPSMDAQGNYQLSSARCEFLMKIIETLIVNDFPLNILVAAYVESPIVERVRNHHQAKVKDVKKGNVLEYQMAILESKLIFFIHVIFHYLHLTNDVIQRDNLLVHWKLILKVIKPFLLSKNPNTCMWILEFINLCAKKYSPKQILSVEKFKSQLHLTINDKLKFIAGVGSKTMNFFYEEPVVDMRADDSVPRENNSYRLILPYTPAIYQLLLEYKDPNRFKATEDISWELFTPVRAANNEAIERRYRFFAFKTLKRIGLELIQNTYMPEKNHWIVTRTKQWIDEILPVVEDKAPENMVFAEAASEVLHDLLDKARSMFLRVLKPDLLKIFNKDDFFICNVPTLKYWSKIIDWVVNFDKNNETFSYYLEKVALSTSYFSSGDGETKKRVKSFERICFILYSGCKDRYSLKIKGLLEKISQILKKSQSAHPSLLILILFAIRILILRLSEITLNQLFIDIWPMIMTLLIQLFSRKLIKVELANEISKHPNLLLAGLKLIEMASVVNLVQFSHHQWIFLYDYFGIKLSLQEGNMEMTEFLNTHPEYRDIFSHERTNNTSPFIFKPSLTNYFPPSNVDYIPQPYPHQLSIKPIKRQLIIKQAQIQDESELRIRAIILCQYLINLNELRFEVDEEDIEMLLVDDFIELDNFIHKM